MKMFLPLLTVVLMLICGASATFGQSARATTGTHKFVGAQKCKMCHSTEKIGAQYKIWEASKHAMAYKDLASDTAKAVAAKLGICDPQKSPECLKCHETGYGLPASMFETGFDSTAGVQCESCHGAGADYWKMATMKGIHANTIDADSVGLRLPTEAVCLRCHNQESPFYHGFDFKTYSAKIAHPLKEE